jgi:hypothetical protein
MTEEVVVAAMFWAFFLAVLGLNFERDKNCPG